MTNEDERRSGLSHPPKIKHSVSNQLSVRGEIRSVTGKIIILSFTTCNISEWAVNPKQYEIRLGIPILAILALAHTDHVFPPLITYISPLQSYISRNLISWLRPLGSSSTRGLTDLSGPATRNVIQ